MANRAIKGDYIGFTFNGVHSSELGLVRVSNGSRYEVDLLPPLQDKTVQVAGRDGAVYFNSQYNAKPIKVPVAFDNLTEEGFEKLKRLLANKKPAYLWFDETPYKQWLVKSATAQKFKWICFDESRNGKEYRIYKGEGTLEFTCFSPYAESRALTLDDEVEDVIVWEYADGRRTRLVTTATTNINGTEETDDDTKIIKTLRDYYNFEEWYKSSRLRDKEFYNENNEKVELYKYDNGQMNVYNAGDIPADVQITFLKDKTKTGITNQYIFMDNPNTETVDSGAFSLKNDLEISLWSSKAENTDGPLARMKIKAFQFFSDDKGFVIDSKIKIIKGIDENGKLTGRQYNKYKILGDFFKIPTTEDEEEYFIIKVDAELPFEIDYKHHYI